MVILPCPECGLGVEHKSPPTYDKRACVRCRKEILGLEDVADESETIVDKPDDETWAQLKRRVTRAPLPKKP